MSESESLLIRANVEVTPGTLDAIVENCKKIYGPNEKGYYQIDTAGKVSEMISKFLAEKDFEKYVREIANYSK